MKAAWVTFEGIGGSGKSTVVNEVYDYFEKKLKKKVIVTREPGGTLAGAELREVVLKSRNDKLLPLTELLLFVADRHETYKKIVEPNIKQGVLVLSDRGLDGSLAYQGFGRGLDMKLIETLNNFSTNKTKPNLTILLDIEPNLSIKRMNQRKEIEQDQFDTERLEFQIKVREGFLYLAKQNPERIVVVDASRAPEEVKKKVIEIITEKLLHEQ
ncbi:dTMP kinase [Paenibacillus koleovorans]|uniref:dTMP kinase n=1 Tax=Paenibacillus koleovorans TaxID=121608 RepID=UPI000FD779E1|nr:dTMP kinase [Paenibacillus koleovorans]